jgi:hypothetical protein
MMTGPILFILRILAIIGFVLMVVFALQGKILPAVMAMIAMSFTAWCHYRVRTSRNL